MFSPFRGEGAVDGYLRSCPAGIPLAIPFSPPSSFLPRWIAPPGPVASPRPASRSGRQHTDRAAGTHAGLAVAVERRPVMSVSGRP